MSGEGQGRKAPGYQLEQGMLGSLLSFGRAALDAALAAGWRPELARRPQVAALGVWLVEQMEQGNVVDLATAVAQLQMFPPQHKDAPSLAEALVLLVPAPNIAASCVEDVAAHARAIIEAKRTDRISELLAGINAAARMGDLDTIAKLSEQMAAVTSPPKQAGA